MLFEEKLKDKRFKETERVIFIICLKEAAISVDTLARKAGISRATFYRHHKAIGMVVKDYEELLRTRLERKFRERQRGELEKWRIDTRGKERIGAREKERIDMREKERIDMWEKMRERTGMREKAWERECERGKDRKAAPKKFYREVLFFVLQNRELFEFLAVRGKGNPFLLLMGRVKPIIVGENRLFRDEAIYRIYAAEVAEVLRIWQEEGFTEEKAGAVLGDILYLTETAEMRLGALRRARKT